MDNLSFLSPTAAIVVGILLLLLGRKLFWVFVGAIGFIAGMRFGATFLEGQPALLVLLVAIGIGILGAILAIFLQRIAVALAGGIAGGMLAMSLATALGIGGQQFQWLAFIVGAIVAAILVLSIFDWALILISAFSGAALIVEHVNLSREPGLILLVILAIVGIAFQARALAPARES